MGDDTEWMKLPTEDKVQHKVWKARVAGYEEAIKLFQRTTDPKSPEFSKFAGLLKKFVADNNAVAQEKALEAVVAFVENAALGPKTCGEVMSALLSKCINASKQKTRDKTFELIMLYIEVDKPDIVQEALLGGLENKQPKVVVGCIQALTMALRDFGYKVMPIKPVLKVLPKLLEDRDKNVRDEAKLLVIEVYRWIGAAIKPQMTNFKPVQVQELEAEFEKLPPGKPQQTRFMRSQQDLKAKMEEQAMSAAASGEQDAEEGEAAQEEIDPYELMPSVDILAQIPKDFYDKVEAKKWQERKEALEQLQKLAESPKIDNGDFSSVIKVLIKVVGKDTNVMIVAVGGKCMAGIAKGLRKKFSPYALQCVQVILEKFKEKKPMVVQALREAIDAIYPSTNLEAVMEDVVGALDNKNPNIKAETASFLTRCFARCTTATLPKKLLKAYVTALLKTVNDTAAEVREASFDALGMAMKVVTEKNISPFLVDLDPIKMQKIQESCQKAVLLNARGEPRGGGGGAAAAAPPASQPKPVQRPPTAKAPPKPAENSSSNAAQPEAGGPPRLSAQAKAVKGGKKAGAKKGAAGKKGGGGDAEVSENALSDEAVEEKMQAFVPGDSLAGLDSSNWKERLASCEKVLEVLKRSSKEEIPCQACVRTLNKKPGLKDTNFQVLKVRLDAVAYLAENAKFTRRSAEFCLTDLVDKVGDPKNSAGAQVALTNIAEAVGFEFVSSEVVRYAFEQKNPKNQSEALNWLSQAIKEFGFKVNIKPMIGNLKTALAATNPTVRSSAISVLATAYMYMGANLRVFFEDEKPALLQQIDAEFEKVKGEKPPAPTRGVAPKGDAGDDEEEDKEEEEDSNAVNVQDLVPRVDISEKVTDGLLTELSDKNWKVRNEALGKVGSILGEAKFVSANIGQLAEALKTRLADSNKILVTTSIGLCQSLAAALGPHCKAHIKTLGPALLSCMGDTKPQVRAAALAALNSWVEPCSLLPLVECEALPDVLKVETPVLRAEVLGWLTEKLPGHKQLPNELRLCVPFVLACLEDRNADVRKKAQEALVPFMIHTGFDAFAKGAAKVKPASKDQIMAILEKARENLPAKPQKTKKAAAAPPPSAQSAPPPSAKSAPPPDKEEDKPPARTPSETRASKAVKGRKSTAAPAASKKKGEEEDTGPLMTMTVTKEQRVKDEKAMKVLKWNFLEVRPEFVEQLRTQMERNFSKTMMDMLFHRDFKFHTKAIENLMKCIEALPDETLCNLDLILKWLTLRFFDTNPSMLNKALEYLAQLFNMLSQQDYHLSELEASSFIPYLIIKVGENKDNVRREVRNIFKLICHVYPGSKMFTFLLDGLKSKNSKQRAECLEELGCLIEVFGLTVCQPSPAAALKAISQQIGDRDTGVRNSALNTMVVAHGILQDNLFKYTNHLNDKDMSLLEERLKRAAKSKPPPKPAQEEPRPKTAPQPRPTSHPSAQSVRPQTALPKSASANSMKQPGEFSLDIDLEPPAPAGLPPLIQHDLEFLNEPLTMPTLKTRPQSPAAKLVGSGEASTTVGYVISQVTSADIPTCIQALAQLDEVLKEERRAEVLAGQVDQLLLTIVMQFKMASSTHLGSESVAPGDVISLHRCLLSTLVAVFEHGSLATRVSRDVLREIFSALISLLLDSRLSDMSEEGPQIIRSVNIVVIKIINCADHTNATSALIRLLQDCAGSETCSAKYLDLVMKCLWRIVKMLPDIVRDLKLERLLLDCHLFLRAFPPSSWRSRPSDTPLRTVKTFLNTLAKLMGAKILNYMGMIEATENSEVDAYLRKLLRNDVASTNARNEELSFDTPGKSASKSKSLSGSTHDTLTEIFKKIGAKEKTKEGLNDLYDFTQAHPEANLEPFLKKSSQFFQSYIDRSLRSIKLEREGKAADTAVPESEMPVAEKDFKGVEYYRERLRNIRAKCGLDADEQEKPPSPQILKMSDSDSRKSSSTESVPDVTSGILTELRSDNRPPPEEEKKSNVELSDLKMRLERIKKLAKT